MNQYHKIHSVYKRDAKGNILMGEYSRPEFEYLQDNLWQCTEKIDGTNVRVMYEHGKITFGGKTDRSQMPTKLLDRLRQLFPSSGRFREVFDQDARVCLYGEGYGAGIQKGGGDYSDTQDFVLFDVWVDGWWLQRTDVEDVAKKFNVEVVPVIHSITLTRAIDIMAIGGFNSWWGPFEAEGFVATPVVPLFARNGDRVITKIKRKDFK